MSYRWRYERTSYFLPARWVGYKYPDLLEVPMKAPIWVKPVAVIFFLAGVGGLTWTGSTQADMSSMLTIGTGAISAIAGIIAAIIGRAK